MKTAVVFCGPVREASLASRSWHLFGDVDYFLITWDCERSLGGYADIDVADFPVKLAGLIVSDYKKFEFIQGGSNSTAMLYNWSLVNELTGINSYDKIIVCRPDYFLCKNISSLKTTVSGIKSLIMHPLSGSRIQDHVVILPPSQAPTFTDMYSQFLTIAHNEREVHKFLHSYYSQNNEKICLNQPLTPPLDVGFVVRPDSPEYIAALPFGKEMALALAMHGEEWWIDNRGIDATRFASKQDQLKFKLAMHNVMIKEKIQ